MAAFLRLHTHPEAEGFEEVAVGDEFEVVDEENGLVYTLIAGHLLSFTREPDELGFSLNDWFDLVE